MFSFGHHDLLGGWPPHSIVAVAKERGSNPPLRRPVLVL